MTMDRSLNIILKPGAWLMGAGYGGQFKLQHVTRNAYIKNKDGSVNFSPPGVLRWNPSTLTKVDKSKNVIDDPTLESTITDGNVTDWEVMRQFYMKFFDDMAKSNNYQKTMFLKAEVLVIDSPLSTPQNREGLAKLLLNDVGFASVAFVKEAEVQAYNRGVDDCIVVDCGADNVVVTPIINNSMDPGTTKKIRYEDIPQPNTPAAEGKISLAGAIKHSIESSPEEMQPEMWSRVILCGGNSLQTGFAKDLQKQLTAYAGAGIKVKVVASESRLVDAIECANYLTRIRAFDVALMTADDLEQELMYDDKCMILE